MIFTPKSDEEDSQQMNITSETVSTTSNTMSSAESTTSPLYQQVIRVFSPYANPDQLRQLERAFNGKQQQVKPSLLEVTVFHLTVHTPHMEEIQSNVRGVLPEPVTLVGHQEQLHTEALLGAKKKEGQEVVETVQLVGHQEQLHTEALMGTKKKEGQEVAETVQLVSHQEQLHTEALIGAKKNQEQLNLAVKEGKVQRMTQKMMTHQLHQA